MLKQQEQQQLLHSTLTTTEGAKKIAAVYNLCGCCVDEVGRAHAPTNTQAHTYSVTHRAVLQKHANALQISKSTPHSFTLYRHTYMHTHQAMRPLHSDSTDTLKHKDLSDRVLGVDERG